jgi:outer membrane protein
MRAESREVECVALLLKVPSRALVGRRSELAKRRGRRPSLSKGPPLKRVYQFRSRLASRRGVTAGARRVRAAFALLSSLVSAAVVATPAQVRAETLGDAIALSYQSNPTLLSQRAELRALDESYVQALAGYRPQITTSLTGDYAQGQSTQGIGVTSASATVGLSQPLYTGGQVNAQVRAAEADIMSGRQRLRATEGTVLQSVIQAYVDLRRDLQVLAIAEDNVTVLTHQLEQTRAELNVGQVSETDVSQAEARLAAAQAQYASAKAQVGVSQANYAAIVGQAPGDLAPESDLPGVPASVDQVMDAALDNNPAIVAAIYAERAAAARVALAKAANHPTAEIRAQAGYQGYYNDDAFLGVSHGMYDRNITASVVITQPLFTGGLNASRIRQALEGDNVQMIGISAARRQTVQLAAQSWNQLMAARANVTADAEQVRAAEHAFHGVQEEAQVGIRTTLDVLNAEQEFHGAQIALVNAQHDEYLAGAGVLNAMGLLEAKNLGTATALYRPEAAFNRVRNASATPLDGLVSAFDSIGTRPSEPVATTPSGGAAHAGAPVLP